MVNIFVVPNRQLLQYSTSTYIKNVTLETYIMRLLSEPNQLIRTKPKFSVFDSVTILLSVGILKLVQFLVRLISKLI